MKESILSALAVAAITGMVFVAYNHPTAYFRIVKRVVWPLIIFFIGTIFFEISGSVFLVGVAPRFQDAAARKILEDFNADMWGRVGIVQLCVIGGVACGFFLGWVAQLKGRTNFDDI